MLPWNTLDPECMCIEWAVAILKCNVVEMARIIAYFRFPDMNNSQLEKILIDNSGV